MEINRRKFITGMTAAAATIPFTNTLAETFKTSPSKKFPVAFFTKPLDGFEPEFMAETLKMAGVDGFDLTVRPKGSVLPERVVDDLPRYVELAKKHDLLSELMVTSINNLRDPFANEVLATAAKNGIQHYRLAYFEYDKQLSVPDSIEKIHNDLKALASLNESLGIQGGYQNHTGTRFGSPMWDLWQSLQGISVDFMSSQFDIRHAVCEGSSSWVLSMKLLSDKIGSLAIKDFTWDISGGHAKVKNVPLGEGIVDFDLYFKTLKALNVSAPITLHMEYPLFTKEEEGLSLLQKQQLLVTKIRKEVDFVKTNLKRYQLI